MDKATKDLIFQALDRSQATLDTIRAIVSGQPSSCSTPATYPRRSGQIVIPASAAPPEERTPAPKTGKPRRISVAESVPATHLTPLSITPAWPQAVPPHMILDQRLLPERQFRALQVVRLLGSFKGQTVLDVGCGDGCVAREIANQADRVVGYDLKEDQTWASIGAPNLELTTTQATVETGQYDIIVLYDVLDHLEGKDPIEFMGWLLSMLAVGGRIMVRTHPWTAKHGGHLYENGYNLAYIHLALTADEMAQAGMVVQPNLRLNHPMAAYEHIFSEAGLRVANKKGYSEPVDEFFKGDVLDRIIKVTWKGAVDKDRALKVMANSFVDYTLIAS